MLFWTLSGIAQKGGGRLRDTAHIVHVVIAAGEQGVGEQSAVV